MLALHGQLKCGCCNSFTCIGNLASCSALYPTLFIVLEDGVFTYADDFSNCTDCEFASVTIAVTPGGPGWQGSDSVTMQCDITPSCPSPALRSYTLIATIQCSDSLDPGNPTWLVSVTVFRGVIPVGVLNYVAIPATATGDCPQQVDYDFAGTDGSPPFLTAPTCRVIT